MLALTLSLLIQAGDLDSKDPVVARKALEEAIKSGDEKALEAAAKTSERARWAMSEIRAHKRFGDNYPPVKLVSFHAKDQALDAFTSAFSKALDTQVEPYNKGTDPGTFCLDLDDAYPLEAVDKFLNEINAQGWLTDRKFQFTRGWTRRNPHVLHWRHAAFFPWKLEEERSLDAVGTTSLTCTLTVIFRHDGRSRIVGLRGPRALEAVDDEGKEVKAEGGEKEPSFYAPQAQGNFQIRMSVPGEKTEKIARIRGVLPVLIPEKRIWKDVPVGGAKVDVSFPNLKITVDKIMPPGATARVTFQVLDGTQPCALPDPRDFQLRDKGGRRLTSKGKVGWVANQWVMDLAFELPGEFMSPVLEVGGYESCGEHDIPFEFRQVKVR